MPRELLWLPDTRLWPSELEKMRGAVPGPRLWAGLRQLANSNLDFVRTVRLDRQLCRLFPEPPVDLTTKPVRLAILASSTVAHLIPSIRIAALRADIWCSVYETSYGQYYQELTNTDSALHRFRPTAILMALDSRHAVSRAGESAAEVAENALIWMEGCWRIASEQFGCEVMQQTLLPVLPGLLGSNEHRLGCSRRRALQIVNELLRQRADAGNVHLVAIDDWAALDGLDVWHSPSLWHTAKQEIDPRQAPFYGELVGRLLAALQGRSKKCLVLDLDNTLWGGVIADDGVAGIVLGQGSAAGEAYADFQNYVRELSKRGIVLTVCSKNEHATAFQAFTHHPEMVLKPADIACFRANWVDKATNIREIAETLNIGLDSFVFFDDNPAERALVRAELPMVAVPELPDEPALYATLLAQSGYFEGVHVTREDRERTPLYRAEVGRKRLMATTDLEAYLKSLTMRLYWGGCDGANLKRVVQLINKTNQFNLTTKRYSAQDVERMISNAGWFTLQMRLVDRFADNGLIAVVLGESRTDCTLHLDTWLMSCRVLGRGVEQATLNVIAAEAARRGLKRITGEYRATSSNGMTRGLYGRLSFREIPRVNGAQEGAEFWELPLESFTEIPTHITAIRASTEPTDP